MTREEAREELKKGIPQQWDWHRDIKAFDKAIKMAIEALEGCLESIEALMAEGEIYDIEYSNSKWIPISERLPEEFVSVLVCFKSQGGMAQCVTERIVDFLDGSTRWLGMCGQKPIAWMALPKPYKAESEVEE